MKNKYLNKEEIEIFTGQNGIFNEKQLEIINRKTPKEEIEIKQDKSGFTYKSVSVGYIKRQLMLIFGGNYNFKILSRDFIPSTRETIVHGRLTVFSNGKKIVREQFGNHYLNTTTSTSGNKTITHSSDIGYGYKAAASDALKKCASELGLCWDIYNQEISDQKKKEVPEPDLKHIKKIERLNHFLNQCTNPLEVEETYEKYLETAKETEDSKQLLKTHMERTLNNS